MIDYRIPMFCYGTPASIIDDLFSGIEYRYRFSISDYRLWNAGIDHIGIYFRSSVLEHRYRLPTSIIGDWNTGVNCRLSALEHRYRLHISVTCRGTSVSITDRCRLSVVEHRYRLPISMIGYGTPVSNIDLSVIGTPTSFPGIDYDISVIGLPIFAF